MDCSLLLGHQLDAMKTLVSALQRPQGPTFDQVNCRELRDRAAVHFQVREQIVLPALQHGRWKGVNSEALSAHVELKRLLAALWVCEPGDAEFPALLRQFSGALQRQQQADREWILPALRRLTTEAERRRLCEEIERLHATLVPPAQHYLEAVTRRRPGDALVQDAALVLSSLGATAGAGAVPRQQGVLE
jgi:hypothetical protein